MTRVSQLFTLPHGYFFKNDRSREIGSGHHPGSLELECRAGLSLMVGYEGPWHISGSTFLDVLYMVLKAQRVSSHCYWFVHRACGVTTELQIASR